MAGSSVAKALADKGWDTLLIDRRPFPRHKVCGEFLSPESRTALQALGLWETVESLGPSPIERVRLVFESGPPLEIPLPGTALGVSRYALDAALHRAAQRSGAEVRTRATAMSVQADGRGYAVETRQGPEIRTCHARAVIAAWGANRRAGLPGVRRPVAARNRHVGVKSHFEGVEIEPVVELYFWAGGYLGVSPVEGGRINVAALLGRHALPDSARTILGLIEAAVRSHPKLERKLAHAVPVPGTQAAVAPVDLGRKPAAWDVIPHVGDAALLISPLCGDGMSMALRSAELCASLADRYLRGELALSEWRREYEQSVRRELYGPWQWGRFVQWLLGVPAMPRLLPAALRLAPELAFRLVRATRLKEAER
jgi:flavin-dependent dehydrogenase